MCSSPSKTTDQFDSFIINFEKLAIDISSRDTHFLQMTSDFNAKSTKWFINDSTKSEGAQLDFLMTKTYLGKLLQLYRPNLHQPNRHCYGLWNTSNSLFKVSSTNSLFKKLLKNWVSSSVYSQNLGCWYSWQWSNQSRYRNFCLTKFLLR